MQQINTGVAQTGDAECRVLDRREVSLTGSNVELVKEHWADNPEVVGSSPTSGTTTDAS